MKHLLKISALSLACLLFVQCNSYQSSNRLSSRGNLSKGMPNEPGKCYAKCMIPDQVNEVEQSYFVYTGIEGSENIILENLEIEVKAPVEKWVKKKSTTPCKSRNPDDCLVWCLVKTEGEYINRTVVVDTTQTQNFKEEVITRTEVIKEGGFIEWEEVICANDITESLLTALQASLNLQGYSVLSQPQPGVLSEDLKAALRKYQKDNHLAEGKLTVATLQKLGVL